MNQIDILLFGDNMTQEALMNIVELAELISEIEQFRPNALNFKKPGGVLAWERAWTSFATSTLLIDSDRAFEIFYEYLNQTAPR